MTTIALNREMICSDSLCVDSGARSVVQKIFAYDDHVIGFAGDVSQGLMFLAWHEAGGQGEYPFDGNFEAVVLYEDGTIYSYDSGLMPIKMEHEYYAIGSGKHAAMAAMLLGCDPLDAVKVAMQVDAGSDGDIQRIDLSALPGKEEKSTKKKAKRKTKHGKANKKTVRRQGTVSKDKGSTN